MVVLTRQVRRRKWGGSALRKALLVGSADSASEEEEGCFDCMLALIGRLDESSQTALSFFSKGFCLFLMHTGLAHCKTPSPFPYLLRAGPTNYRIEVVTSDVRGAGTDADVSIVIYGETAPAVQAVRSWNVIDHTGVCTISPPPPRLLGEKGDSGERKLDSHMHNDFERGQVGRGEEGRVEQSESGWEWGGAVQGSPTLPPHMQAAELLLAPPPFLPNSLLPHAQTDVFFHTCPNVGHMQKIKLKSSGTGLGAPWHLARAVVTSSATGETLPFPYNNWFDKEHGLEQVKGGGGL